MLPNQTIYEILRVVDSKMKRQNEKASPGAMNDYLAQIYNRESDQITIHFAIKDK